MSATAAGGDGCESTATRPAGGFFIREPIEGEVLEALDSGRLEIGSGTLLEPGCWLTLSGEARIRIGKGCFLNRNTMLAALELIEIGDHVMFANNCFVGDSDHRYDDPTKPITWQGFEPRGPVRIGSNCWFGVGLRGHRRRADRRALRDRRQFGDHPRSAGRRDRRRSPGEGDSRDRVQGAGCLMLRLRLAVEEHRAGSVAEALEGTGGVHRIVALTPERAGTGVVLAADVTPAVADRVMDLIKEWEVEDGDYLLTRQEVIAPAPHGRGRFATGEVFAWVEVMGEARIYSRPLARYLALMAVAAFVAALGVIRDNPILIVGAMAVSPDLLPVCALCVGIVGRRVPLARNAAVTLLLGLGLVAAIACGLAAVLDATGAFSGQLDLGSGGLRTLGSVDYSTVLVALAAGVAAMLAFETRAAAAVGVAISVTTIPASALLGVSLGLGDGDRAGGAALVLAVNVVLLILSGTLTLVLQRWFVRRRSATQSSRA